MNLAGVLSLMRRVALRVVIALLTMGTMLSTAHAHTQPNPVPQGWPKLISIPKIHVRASIEDINFARKSDYEAPYNVNDVAWYDVGARPGDVGHAAIFGHLDSICCPAVFYNLRLLEPGDMIYVMYRNGHWLGFRVIWQHSYPNDRLPLSFIYGGSGQRGLVLVTCSGIFHRDGSGYDHKSVVYARLAYANGKLG